MTAMDLGNRTAPEHLPGAALSRDIAAGEHVEHEIDAFISRNENALEVTEALWQGRNALPSSPTRSGPTPPTILPVTSQRAALDRCQEGARGDFSPGDKVRAPFRDRLLPLASRL